MPVLANIHYRSMYNLMDIRERRELYLACEHCRRNKQYNHVFHWYTLRNLHGIVYMSSLHLGNIQFRMIHMSLRCYITHILSHRYHMH